MKQVYVAYAGRCGNEGGVDCYGLSCIVGPVGQDLARAGAEPTLLVTDSVGESVRIMRQLQELSQNQLSQLTGIPQATISSIENDRIRLGVERAKV